MNLKEGMSKESKKQENRNSKRGLNRVSEKKKIEKDPSKKSIKLEKEGWRRTKIGSIRNKINDRSKRAWVEEVQSERMENWRKQKSRSSGSKK